MFITSLGIDCERAELGGQRKGVLASTVEDLGDCTTGRVVPPEIRENAVSLALICREHYVRAFGDGIEIVQNILLKNCP
jgi:hypothetical protein